MEIFSSRSHWKSLLSILSEEALLQCEARYQTLIEKLDVRAAGADEVDQATLQSVRDSYQFELQEVRGELSRRRHLAA